jgi:hypothetical protein
MCSNASNVDAWSKRGWWSGPTTESKNLKMKNLIVCSLTIALSLGLSAGAFAQAKPKATPAPAAAPAAEKPGKKANGPVPMYTRVDSIDAKAKTFTLKRKADGVEVKHILTATTDIKNGDAAAKFEDIKVGDYVSGLRQRKGETEWEVLKITKIGPPAPKKEKEKKAE